MTGRRPTAKLAAFYGRLLPCNALVFDIGANIGRMAETFASLGARVVALEPNRDCLRRIEISHGDGRIETIQAVAGPKNGLAVINVSDTRHDMSSLSEPWMAAMQHAHGEFQNLWSRRLTIPMLTLDTLVQHYGDPYFIKIDVEGFEESVLDGLSVQPPLLSFEFHLTYFDAAVRCLNKSLFAADSKFNFAFEDPVQFELPDWTTREGVQRVLADMPRGDQYGDIFVKRCH